MKEIRLSQGKFALVDDEDYEWLNQYKWQHATGYAVRHNPLGAKKISMSRTIVNCPNGMVVDHINHNTLDNRRSNLRICTYSQNSINKQKIIIGSSRYKGVKWNVKSKSWQVRISYKHTSTYIGEFKNELHAAMAYALWAKDIYGEYSFTEFQ